MKVMLLYPIWTSNYGITAHFAKRGSTWPPLNLAYLAAEAEKEGHEVKIIDGQVEGMSLSKMIDHTEAFNPDIIGITATTPFYHIATDLARGLKEANSKIPIAIGGPHITLLKQEAFAPSFTYAFIGESDRSWPTFLRQCQKGGPISGVKGILFREDGEVKFTGAAEPIDNLDSIPFPARHLLKMNKYKLGTLQGKKNFTSIMFSRGCPFKCIFCSTKVFGSRVRRRPVRSVVDEIISVVSEFNIRHFYFADDNLTLDRHYILEMCNLIDRERLSITFEGSTRADLIDEELVARLAHIGLIRLSFGLETVDPEMRRIMRKGVPLESYSIANRLTNKYGVETLNSVMIGLPGETRDTIRKTLSYLRNTRDIQQANCSIAVPYPGTELYDMARKGEHRLKLMTQDFSEYRRYGSAVMSVGDLSPDDLIKLQNDAFVSIYLAPWRIRPMLKKMGIIGGLLMLIRLIKSLDKIGTLVLRLKMDCLKKGGKTGLTRVQGPLFSVTASGTIGDAIVYSNWKGLPYVRSRVIPANPRTDLQQSQRTLLTSGVSVWQNIVYPAAGSQFTWNLYASGMGMSGFNRYMKAFLEINKVVNTPHSVPNPTDGAMPGWVPW